MLFSDYRFLLDVHEINSQISLSFKQGDTSRVLYITLTEEGEVFNIPADCVAVFTALKPDGTIIFNDCEINGNEISYTITQQTTVVSGKVDCEIRLYGAGNTLITSPHITVFVHPTVYADLIVESHDEVNTLTALISEANTLIASVNSKLDNGDFVPKLSIGTVNTLPAGSNATASFTGTGVAPVLNLGIPMGEQGQAETVIPDSELSLESTKPVQNKVITAALETKADKAANNTVISENADFAEIGWWLDGNPNNEDRTGYFVCIDDNVEGTGMRIAGSGDDIRGVVVKKPAFSGNATADKFDENGELLPKYDYVGIMGLVSVIDDGSCVVNERCMPNDEGIAAPSSNTLGYHVIERIDSSHVLIAIEPNGDMVQRIKTDVEALESGVEKLQNDKVDKVSGMGLSSNDFTDAEKSKLAGIAANANDYTLPALGVESGHLAAGAVTTAKLADAAVTRAKLADAAVTRAKLADDALYSPIIMPTATCTLTASGIGKTLRLNNEAVDYIINIVKDTNIPTGAEYAIFKHWCNSNKIVFGSDTKLFLPGESNSLTGVTLRIDESFTMIALKKVASDASYDYWLVTGNVEVLS